MFPYILFAFTKSIKNKKIIRRTMHLVIGKKKLMLFFVTMILAICFFFHLVEERKSCFIIFFFMILFQYQLSFHLISCTSYITDLCKATQTKLQSLFAIYFLLLQKVSKIKEEKELCFIIRIKKSFVL